MVTGAVIAYALRVQPSRLGRTTARLATIGYAVPGTVVAVAVYVPLVWVDRRLVDGADAAFGTDIGLVFTGSILGLIIAYLVRFHALSYTSIESRMGRIQPSLDDAARSLGADRARVFADVHLPLLRPGLAAAALLVLVEVMKELPATALLRPLGRDTLAITVWEATKDSRVDTAALPALLIVLVGLLPIILLVRVGRSGEARPSSPDRLVRPVGTLSPWLPPRPPVHHDRRRHRQGADGRRRRGRRPGRRHGRADPSGPRSHGGERRADRRLPRRRRAGLRRHHRVRLAGHDVDPARADRRAPGGAGALPRRRDGRPRRGSRSCGRWCCCGPAAWPWAAPVPGRRWPTALVALLNAGLTPVVHEHGSLGASGDLAPLAEAAMVLHR